MPQEVDQTKHGSKKLRPGHPRHNDGASQIMASSKGEPAKRVRTAWGKVTFFSNILESFGRFLFFWYFSGVLLCLQFE